MIHLDKNHYPYLEEINEGIFRQFRKEKAPPPTAPKVLDVGCGQAALGEAIRNQGYEVWGLEENGAAVERAKGRINQMVHANILDFNTVDQALEKETFDYLVFSDVLEHLYHPKAVLTQYLKYLKPGGKLVVSVPNALAWAVRLQFLMGRFNYQDTGILDRTHIRFFTYKTAESLVKSTHCRVIRIDSDPYLVRAMLPLLKKVLIKKEKTHNPRGMLDSKFFQFYKRWIYPVEYRFSELRRSLFSFRIIIVAEKPMFPLDN